MSTPTLPTEISGDGREVFEWASKFSDHVHLLDEIRRTRTQISNCETQCGSCSKWMTPSCPREVHSNKTGRWAGPSSLTIKCDQFAMSAGTAKMNESAKAKLAELEAKAAQ